MLAIGMPGPFEWVILLVLFTIIFGGLMIAFRIYRALGRPPRDPNDRDRRP